MSGLADGVTSLVFGLVRPQLKDAFLFGHFIFKGHQQGGSGYGEYILKMRKLELDKIGDR